MVYCCMGGEHERGPKTTMVCGCVGGDHERERLPPLAPLAYAMYAQPPQATNGRHVLTHVVRKQRDPRGAPVDASLEAVSAELNQLNDVAFRDAQAREARVAVGVFTGARVRQIGSKPPPWPPKVCRCQM